MLFSLSLILILGFSLSGIFNRLKLPGLLGMILTGIILGPYALNLISPDILDISSDLREIALIIILTRAGCCISSCYSSSHDSSYRFRLWQGQKYTPAHYGRGICG